MNPQELLQAIVAMLSPQEAEGAQRQAPIGMAANPMVDFLTKLQATQAAQLQREQAMAQFRAALQTQAQQAKESSPLGQAQLAKALPKPDLASLLGMGTADIEAPVFPGDVLGGGPGAPITFGTNPRTGEQAFNNFGWVNPPSSGSGRVFETAQRYSGPKSQAGVAAAIAKGTKANAPDQEALTKLAQAFHEAGYPVPAEISKRLAESFTGGPLPTPEQASKMFKFDPESMTFTPPQGDELSLSARELLKRGFMLRTQAQLDAPKTINQMLNSFNLLEQDYKILAGQGYFERVAGKIPLGIGSQINKTAGAYLKDLQNFTTFFDNEFMGKRGAASPQMQVLRARVLPGLEMNPELGGVLMDDWRELLNAHKGNETAMLAGKPPNYKSEDDIAMRMVERYNKLTSGSSTGARQQTRAGIAASTKSASGRAATMADMHEAMLQAQGDKAKALELLRQKGIDTSLNME